MLHCEMMDRMPILELNYWAAFYDLQNKRAGQKPQPKVRSGQQPPQQIIAFLDSM